MGPVPSAVTLIQAPAEQQPLMTDCIFFFFFFLANHLQVLVFCIWSKQAVNPYEIFAQKRFIWC